MFRDMFKKTYTLIDTKYKASREEKDGKGAEAGSVGAAHREPNIPEGLWRKCNKCGQPIYVEDVVNNHYVCPKCGGYFRVHAYRRIQILADEGTFEEWNREMEFSNPLDFPGYERKVLAAKEKTGLNEAIVTGKAEICGQPAVIGVCDARFLMSSMGHIVGEKITAAVERATEEKLPVILFAASGGARMQEGIVSLMQMAKTSAALKRHHEAGQLFISVLTDPTTGGVTASFAMLGDIIIAEPKALIGFAGPRVIEQTIGQKLPEGFQRAEFLLDHGFVDMIVERKDQKDVIGRILKMHRNDLRFTGGVRRMTEIFAGEDAAKENFVNENAAEKNFVKENTVKESSEKECSGKENTAKEKSEGFDAGKAKSAWDTVLLSRKS
ncbi:MAG: acetyl-CoA carboxylase, carboxyltransferase subunit beta, partial [Lachnospiraceae bacterium]|nr:acetyl-CoA carboxylase, carboxyltransferase subunit beta [Lachnospiraceae bacterium]